MSKAHCVNCQCYVEIDHGCPDQHELERCPACEEIPTKVRDDPFAIGYDFLRCACIPHSQIRVGQWPSWCEKRREEKEKEASHGSR